MGETRDFAQGIDADFFAKLKDEGLVTIEGLKQYAGQLEDAIKDFKTKNKDYSVQQARNETIQKILALW